MRIKTIKAGLLSMSMSVLATVAFVNNEAMVEVQAQEVGTYVVQAGEGLYGIAEKHGMTLQELMQLNGLSNYFIYPGQVLSVRSSEQTVTTITDQSENEISTPNNENDSIITTNPKTSPTSTYRVQAGDYLQKIAEDFGVTTRQLRAWNDLSSNLILPGDVLIVSNDQTISNEKQETTVKTEEPKRDTQNLAQPSGTETYRVQAGDYLQKIAVDFGVTTSQLRTWNKLRTNLILPGDVLIVSNGSTSASTTRETETQPKQEAGQEWTSNKTYQVKPGDWLNKISSQFGITTAELKAWNNLRSDLIHPGEVLIVSKVRTNKPVEKPISQDTSEKAASPVNSNETMTYKVQIGDYLNKIASQFGVTTGQLRTWNNLRSNLILPGDTIIVSKGQTDAPIQKVEKDQESNKDTEKQVNQPAKTYTVKPGDYLYKIATKYGITVEQLKSWNNLSSNYIYAGDILKVSQAVTAKPAPIDKETENEASNETKPPVQTTVQTYTVKPGEWVNKIASQFGVTADQLRSWNNLSSDLIHPGDQLIVKKSTDSGSTPIIKPDESSKINSSKVKTYVVKHGDSVYSIANKFGVSIANLKKWNDMTSNYIYPGYVLYVNEYKPASPIMTITDEGAGYGQNQTISHMPYQYSYHQVQAGDTLETIAWQHEMTVSELRELNNLSSNALTPGQKILLSKYPTQQKVNIEPQPVNKNVDRILDIARSYLGVKKYSAEHRALVDAYNRIYPKPVGYTLSYDDDWCDAFVTHIADEAGLSHLVGREVGVERHKNILKNKGVWIGLSQPKAGDIVIYNWNGDRYGWASHIGIVESFNNGKITTFEGNTTLDGSTRLVARKEFAWNSKYIQGYGRPRY